MPMKNFQLPEQIIILPELIKWFLIASAVGILSGIGSGILLSSLEWATNWRQAHLWIIAFLPLAGFFSKMFLFFSAISQSAYFLSVIGILTSVVSCFYYIRIVQVTYFEQQSTWITLKKVSKEISVLTSIVTLMLIVFFIHPNLLIISIHNSILDLCI